MSLEDLEKRLYAERERSTRKRTPSRRRARPAAESPVSAAPERWAPERAKRQFPFLRWLGVGAVVLLLVAGAVAIVLLTSSGGSGEQVTLSLYAPSEIYRGVPFDLEVNVENRLDTVMRDVSLTLNLPAELVYVGNIGTDRAIASESVGDIGGRTVARKSFKLLAVGAEHSLLKASVTASYGTDGRSRFQATETKEITVTRSAVKITATKPDRVVSGSAFEVEIDYENVSDFNFQEIALRLKYPEGFRFQSASMNPDSLDNYWRLGALQASSKGVLRVKGILTGVSEAKFEMPVTLAANFGGEEYPVAEGRIDLSLASAPVALQVLVNGREDYVARAGDVLTYTIPYKNESGIALSDTVLKLSLSGELFDFATVETDARVDASSNMLTWNSGNVPAFRSLDAGASGEVRATVHLKSSYPIRRLSDKNFILRAQARVDSPSVPYYLTADKTTALANLETKVAGLTLVDAQAFFRDAAAMVLNQGKVPPQVGQPTEYTVHWVLRNYGTDVKGIEVKAFLPPGAAWTGQVKSNVETIPLCNEQTGEILWRIEKMVATKGVISDPVEAIFQIRATPSASQVGQYQPLLGETMLTASDDFTGLTLTSRDTALTTALPDDHTVGGDAGKVIP